jgi:hypothetical protein
LYTLLYPFDLHHGQHTQATALLTLRISHEQPPPTSLHRRLHSPATGFERQKMDVVVKEDDELLQDDLEDEEDLTEEEAGPAFEAPQGLIVGALKAPNTKSVSSSQRSSHLK